MKIFHSIGTPLLVSCLAAFIFSCTDPGEPIVIGLDPAVAHTENDVAYGTNARQVMDVFLPANRDKSRTRVFVWIHGGAWIDGDKGELSLFRPWLEETQDDYAYIALNYRLFNLLGNANKFPAQEEDIEKALAFIASKLDEWDLSDNLVLAGASAGGHLTLLHSYKNNADGLVKAAVAFFPPTELKSFHANSPVNMLLLENLLGGSPQSIPLAYSGSSPVEFVTAQTVPTVFFHGDADTVVPISQSQILEDRLVASKVLHVKEYLPGQGHGFDEATYRRLIGVTEVFLDGIFK